MNPALRLLKRRSSYLHVWRQLSCAALVAVTSAVSVAASVVSTPSTHDLFYALASRNFDDKSLRAISFAVQLKAAQDFYRRDRQAALSAAGTTAQHGAAITEDRYLDNRAAAIGSSISNYDFGGTPTGWALSIGAGAH